MTREEKCRFLWEKIGECWHEDADGIKGCWHTCDKCGEKFALGSFLVDPPKQYDFDPFEYWDDARKVLLAVLRARRAKDAAGMLEEDDVVRFALVQDAWDAGVSLDLFCDAAISAMGGTP